MLARRAANDRAARVRGRCRAGHRPGRTDRRSAVTTDGGRDGTSAGDPHDDATSAACSATSRLRSSARSDSRRTEGAARAEHARACARAASPVGFDRRRMDRRASSLSPIFRSSSGSSPSTATAVDRRCWCFCGTAGRGESFTAHLPELLVIATGRGSMCRSCGSNTTASGRRSPTAATRPRSDTPFDAVLPRRQPRPSGSRAIGDWLQRPGQHRNVSRAAALRPARGAWRHGALVRRRNHRRRPESTRRFSSCSPTTAWRTCRR